jgi:hypothetical protein
VLDAPRFLGAPSCHGGGVSLLFPLGFCQPVDSGGTPRRVRVLLPLLALLQGPFLQIVRTTPVLPQGRSLTRSVAIGIPDVLRQKNLWTPLTCANVPSVANW